VVGAGGPHQRPVTLVEGTHRRHEPDRAAARPGGIEVRPEISDALDDERAPGGVRDREIQCGYDLSFQPRTGVPDYSGGADR
jgi:hypothetical protein